VKKSILLYIPILLCALSNVALPQRATFPTPPAPMNPDNANQAPVNVTLPKHVDLVQLQQEADDLARTAQTIPEDVAQVRNGTLPKDVIQKLKQIEKLSKHLRAQISQ
jgi:hypothetical protein